MIKILIVEDHPIARMMISKILESLHCQIDIDVAEDGETALNKAKNKNYDLIFMDIGLPDIDGYTVTLRIREREKTTQRIPIVALTANANDAEKAKAMSSGMDDFYAKPLTTEMAQKIINRYVKQRDVIISSY
jgi:two-component system, OmpR family, aerobic respiration control sensor histidine kinase ArcB